MGLYTPILTIGLMMIVSLGPKIPSQAEDGRTHRFDGDLSGVGLLWVSLWEGWILKKETECICIYIYVYM